MSMMETAALIPPPAVRHCDLDIELAARNLISRGVHAECIAFVDYHAWFYDLEDRLRQAGIKTLAARRLHTRRMPVVVFYTGTEPGLLEAYRSAYSLMDHCEGCWTRDAG